MSVSINNQRHNTVISTLKNMHRVLQTRKEPVSDGPIIIGHQFNYNYTHTLLFTYFIYHICKKPAH